MKFFDFEYRVRYGDTDKLGISYYGNYFAWFEAARTEYFRALGLPYTECEKKGYFLPVVETGAKYFSPCTYDDLIVVRTSVNKLGKTSLHFQYRVFHLRRQDPQGPASVPQSLDLGLRRQDPQGPASVPQSFDLGKDTPKVIATGFSVHAFVDRSMKPVRMPEEIRGIVKEHSLLP